MASSETTMHRGTYTAVWDVVRPECHQPEVAALRRALEPNLVPSGISGFALYESDHIALFVSESAPDHLPLLARFIAAGYLNSHVNEILSLELSQGRSSKAASSLVQDAVQGSVTSRVDVRDSDRNYGDYEPEHFTLEGMWNAMRGVCSRFHAGAGKRFLRCASEDCSAFLGWLDNPHEYLRYESRLDIDLGRIIGGDYVQLCTFLTSTLDRLNDSGHICAPRAVEEILVSHSRVIFATGGSLLFDEEARFKLRERYPLSASSRLAIRLRSWLTRAQARLVGSSASGVAFK